jgi:hypothetical protein
MVIHIILLSNGYSRQVCKTRALLMQIWQGESHFSRKWPLASVGESGESAQRSLANVGESGESAQHGLANVSESGEYLPSLVGNVGARMHDRIGRFKHK